MGIFQRLNIERGITIILITHEMDIAEYGTQAGSLPRRQDPDRSEDRQSPRCRGGTGQAAAARA